VEFRPLGRSCRQTQQPEHEPPTARLLRCLLRFSRGIRRKRTSPNPEAHTLCQPAPPFFTANRMSDVGFLESVGTRDFSGFRGTWWAATDRDHWPANPRIRASIERSFVEPFGDRQQEIVLMSPDLDQQACDRCLSACLLTGEELEQGEQSWRLLHGPFPEAEHLSHVH
jgi:hypothetical protein